MHSSKQSPSWFQYPKFNWKNKHAVVIGAGIAGCQMAWHLSQQGWQVTLIERHEQIATEASGNPAGVISPKMTAKPSAGEDFYRSCFEYTLGLLKQLKTPDWHQCGLLQLTHNNRETERWKSLKERDFSEDFLQLLDEESTDEIAGISQKYKASYFRQAGWIDPKRFCKALLNASNCKTLLATEAICLEKQNDLWHVLNERGESIANAEVVIVTNGKDLNCFEQTQNLPTMPVAGQTTVTPVDDYSKDLKTCLGHEGYLTPASENVSQITFGASFERNVSEATLQTNTDKQNLAQLHKYLPQLADSFESIESGHAAIRMTTPDRFPYVGALPDIDFYSKEYDDLHLGKHWKDYPPAQYQTGLFVLGGLGSRGLTTSGLCAKSLVDLLENNAGSDKQKQLILNCHPARFLIKQLKRKTKPHE